MTFSERMTTERAAYSAALNDLSIDDDGLQARRKRLEIFEALAEIERTDPSVLADLVAELTEIAR